MSYGRMVKVLSQESRFASVLCASCMPFTNVVELSKRAVFIATRVTSVFFADPRAFPAG